MPSIVELNIVLVPYNNSSWYVKIPLECALGNDAAAFALELVMYWRVSFVCERAGHA